MGSLLLLVGLGSFFFGIFGQVRPVMFVGILLMILMIGTRFKVGGDYRGPGSLRISGAVEQGRRIYGIVFVVVLLLFLAFCVAAAAGVAYATGGAGNAGGRGGPAGVRQRPARGASPPGRTQGL